MAASGSSFQGALAVQPRGAWLEGKLQLPGPSRSAKNQGHTLPRQPVSRDQTRQRYKGSAILAQHGTALKGSAFPGGPLPDWPGLHGVRAFPFDFSGQSCSFPLLATSGIPSKHKFHLSICFCSMRQVEDAKRELGATAGPARHGPGDRETCRVCGEPDLPWKDDQPAQTCMMPRHPQDAQAIPERQRGSLGHPHRMLGVGRGRTHCYYTKRSWLGEKGSDLSSDNIDSSRIRRGWGTGRRKSLGVGG